MKKWRLFNKNTVKEILIAGHDGFRTLKELVEAVDCLEYDEEARKVCRSKAAGGMVGGLFDNLESV